VSQVDAGAFRDTGEGSRSTGTRRSKRLQDAALMPASLGDASTDLSPISCGIWRDAALVPVAVAVPAGSGNVGRGVTTAVASGGEVLGGALEQLRLGGRQAVAAGERRKVVLPHGRAAVVAAPMLTNEGEVTCFLEGFV
jgi:hypothetical protein